MSVFRKILFQPIENIVLPGSGNYVMSPRNGMEGRLTGAEVEARIGLDRPWARSGLVLPMSEPPSALEHFAISANYSRVESEVGVQTAIDNEGNPILRRGPLGGQSSFSLNLGLFYASGVFEGSILYAAFGKRLAQVGADAIPEQPAGRPTNTR